MNYEEKYKQALLRAKEFMTNKGVAPNADAFKTAKELTETIFPELKESEDERIREELLDYLKRFIPHTDMDLVKKSKVWIAWLEKQKPVELAKDDLSTLENWIGYIQDKSSELELNDWFVEATKKVVNKMKILLVQYPNMMPKEMDEDDKNFWLEKQGEQKPTPKFKIGDTIHKIGENTVFPRTIEKIEDGDYVCNNSHSFINIKFQDDYELVEQKSSWSEEDEKFLNYVISLTDDAQIKNFLKSLKDRVQPHTKQEWSEEDDKRINSIISSIEYCLEQYPDRKEYVKDIDWLKSLNLNNWRPSEEQMEAFAIAVHDAHEHSYYKNLFSLYNDLKKLNER